MRCSARTCGLWVSGAALVLAFAAAPAAANPNEPPRPGAFGTLVIDGQSFNLDLTQPLPAGGVEFRTDDGDALRLTTFLLDPDPTITFAGSAIDSGDPSTFGFSFGTPIDTVSGPYTVTSTIAGSLTDGGNNGATVSPIAPANMIETVLASASGPTGPFVTILSDGPGFSVGPTQTNVYGPFTGSGSGTSPAGGFNFLRTDINVALTGGNDAFAFTKRVDLVPEPGSLVLLGLASAALLAQRRRGASV